MAPKTTSTPAEGSKAPAFSLNSSEGRQVSLSSLKGKKVVLYFYPKDNTPGCTVEAKQFRDKAKAIEKAGGVIVGVSPDNTASHCSFRDKYDLNFILLSDEDHRVAEQYGVWVEKNMYGRKYWGIQRATFLIGANGKIARVWPKVKADGHAQEVLAALQAMD